ncbi:MAG TPA: hypothetical protein VEG33_11240 [Streptosporangiaceae bacterium]|nr:hypothetical protein [Streptosporangiaceae bacterium]
MTERAEATGGTPPGGPASGAPARESAGGRGPGPVGEPAGGRAVAGRRGGQHLLALVAYGGLSLAMFGPWIVGRMTTWFLSASTQDGSPYLIDEFGMGHPNLSLVFLVPLAAYLAVRLLDGSLPARVVVPLLGLVLAAQLYISTETFATLTLMGGLFALIGLAAGPRWRRRLRAAIGPVAGAYALAAAAGIPLFYAAAAWPRPYKPILFATIGHGAQGGGDFLRYLIPGRFTLLWDGSHWGGYGNPWYLGVPLLVLLILFVATERRWRSTWLLTAGLLVTLVLSIGDTLAVSGARVLPWRLAAALPLLGSAQPGRLVVYAFLLIAVIVARWLARPRRPALRSALAAAAALVILPNFPGDVWASRVPVPAFLTQGIYHRYLRPGEIVWIVDPHHDRQMIWQARTGFSFRLAGGFFGVTPLRPARPAGRGPAGAPGYRGHHGRLGRRRPGLPGQPPGRRGAHGRAAARLGCPPHPGRRDRRRGRPVRPGGRVPAPHRAHRVTPRTEQRSQRPVSSAPARAATASEPSAARS